MLATREMAELTRQQIPGTVLETWPDLGVKTLARFAHRVLEFMGL